MMKPNMTITLKDNRKYLLLLESELDLEGYFLAVQLDNEDNPTNTYAVLQSVEKDGREYVKKIDNILILNQLYEDYRLQYDEEFGE